MDKRDKMVYEELEYGIKRISSWYKKNLKSLSILTVPFNSSLVFENIILEAIRRKEKILYIWSGYGEVRELIDKIRLKKRNVRYAYVEEDIADCDIVFLNCKNISKIKKIYNLAIFDDVSSYSRLSTYNLKGAYEYTLEISQRSILYTIEPVIPIGEQFQLTNINKEVPFIEPRIITTRIDLNKDIPYALYDYLKWFRDEKKKVAIFVPDKDKLDLIYNYYIDKLRMERVKVIKYSKNDEKRYINNGLKIKDKAIFIITDYMEVSLEEFKIEEVVVLLADNSRFNYKKLIYLCGNISRLGNRSSEILFVSRDVSGDMEITKDMAREFNKRIWERKSMNF